MTPMPSNPTMVILIDPSGTPVRVASNVAIPPELNLIVTVNADEYREASCGQPFEGIHPSLPDDFVR